MVALTTLHLRNTQRNVTNFPSNLDNLKCLKDVDLSYNELSRVPDSFYSLSTLERLNLSNNEIEELSMRIGKIHFCISGNKPRFIDYRLFLYNVMGGD